MIFKSFLSNSSNLILKVRKLSDLFTSEGSLFQKGTTLSGRNDFCRFLTFVLPLLHLLLETKLRPDLLTLKIFEPYLAIPLIDLKASIRSPRILLSARVVKLRISSLRLYGRVPTSSIRRVNRRWTASSSKIMPQLPCAAMGFHNCTQ